MKPRDWQRVQIKWTWREVAWILNHAGRRGLEHVIAYSRDVRDLAENPTPPLVAWAVEVAAWEDPLGRGWEKLQKVKRPVEL